MSRSAAPPSSVFVADVDRALSLYRDLLGCAVAEDVRLGAGVRWLLLRAPAPGSCDLLLEPDSTPVGRLWQQAQRRSGAIGAHVAVLDLDAVLARLSAAGLVYTEVPGRRRRRAALVDDACGNVIAVWETPPGAR